MPEAVTGPAPAGVADAPAEPEEIGVVTAPFRIPIGDTLNPVQPGRILTGASLAKARAAGCPLREPTVMELRQYRATIARRDMLAPATAVPALPTATPAMRVPDLAEAREITLRNPLALADMQRAAFAELQKVARSGAPPRLIETTWRGFGQQHREAGDDRATMLVVWVHAINFYRDLASKDLRMLRMQEEDALAAARGPSAAANGFNAAQWLRTVGARGVSVIAEGDELLVRPRGSLNSVDERLIREHRGAILAAARDFEHI